MRDAFTVSNIIVAATLEEPAEASLRYARLFAERYSARVTVLHTIVSEKTPRVSRSAVRKQIAEIMKRCRFEVELAEGGVLESTLRTAAAKGADLIVMGMDREPGWRRVLAASLYSEVFHGSDCPLLVVPSHHAGPEEAQMRRIVCPVNRTSVAAAAARAAAAIASVFESDLFFLHAVEPDASETVVGARELVKEWLEREIDSIHPYHEVVLCGPAADRILRCAADAGAGLIVAGAQRNTPAGEGLGGTTTERLIVSAVCPVLIVSPPETGYAEQPIAEAS